MPETHTEPCRNCRVPVYLDYARGEVPPVGGRRSDWVWKHVGWREGKGCDNPEPRRTRPVEELPGL